MRFWARIGRRCVGAEAIDQQGGLADVTLVLSHCVSKESAPLPDQWSEIMTRVFVSSVVEGFQHERAAARAAIETLRMTPVMAEDFGATASTPRTACLDKVRDSDLLIAVLGERYGYKTDAGMSVCEEELQEAEKRAIPVLAFITRGKMDSQQIDFARRVEDYRTGYFVDFWNDADELGKKIIGALHDHVVQGTTVLGQKEAGEVIEKFTGYLEPDHHADTHMSMIVVPSRVEDEYLSVLELGTSETKNHLRERALFGKPPLFDADLGSQWRDEAEYVVLEQVSNRGDIKSALHCHPNGYLGWRTMLRNEAAWDGGLAEMFLIDEDKMRLQMTAFLIFAGDYYDWLAKKCSSPGVYITVCLWNIGTKRIGHIPQARTSSFSMGYDCAEFRVLIPRKPMAVSMRELKNTTELMEKLMAFVIRTAKAQDFYYESGKNAY